jgi:hypothetical protein
MPKGPPSETLTLDLKGSALPMAKFEKAVVAFFALIREVTAEVEARGEKVKWTISVKSGSALVTAKPSYEPESRKAALRVLRSIPTGISQLEKGTDELPRDFTPKAAELVKVLGTIKGDGDEGVAGVRLRSEIGPVPITTKSAFSVDSIMGFQHQSHGSIEGRMQAISERHGFRFVIYDSLFDRKVDCFFDEELVEKAVSSFRKRIRASGTVQYNRHGQPVSVNVTDIYEFKPNAELPSISDVKGILRET